MNYVFYVALGTATVIGAGAGCSDRSHPKSLNGIESRIDGIDSIDDKPKDNADKTEDYKR